MNKLSPQKYIIKKGRELPFYECYVTGGWQDYGLATFWISKKMPSGIDEIEFGKDGKPFFISGAQVIARMRHDSALYFTMHHLTNNSDKNETVGMRVIERFRLRFALPNNAVKTDPDLYLL